MNEAFVNAGILHVSQSMKELCVAIPKNYVESRLATNRLLQSVSSLKKLIRKDREADFLAKINTPRKRRGKRVKKLAN
jgi:hypothetical protein